MIIISGGRSLCRSDEGRGQMTENRNQDSFREDVFPDLELEECIWRGWIVPVGGSTPDRHKVGGSIPDRHKPTGIYRYSS